LSYYDIKFAIAQVFPLTWDIGWLRAWITKTRVSVRGAFQGALDNG